MKLGSIRDKHLEQDEGCSFMSMHSISGLDAWGHNKWVWLQIRLGFFSMRDHFLDKSADNFVRQCSLAKLLE